MKTFNPVSRLLILMMFLHIHCTNVNDPDPPNDESWSAILNGMRFRIYTDKSSYRQNEDVLLNVEFENIGDSSIVILVHGEQIVHAMAPPLYDLEKSVLSVAGNGGSSSSADIIPLQSNMLNVVPDLFKLAPKQVYHEESSLSSDFWINKAIFEQTGDHIRLSLTPGAYTLQAIYSWEELPYPTPERQQQLAELNAPLWKGTLESNKITITVTP